MIVTFLKKAAAYLLIFAVCAGLPFQDAVMLEAHASTQSDSGEAAVIGYERQDTYQSYLERYLSAPKPDASIVITAQQLYIQQNVTVGTYLEKKNAMIFDGEISQAVYRFKVEKSGLYQLQMNYASLSGEHIRNIEFSLSLDGKIPFAAAGRINLTRSYQMVGGITQDKNGNDIRPQREIVPVWMLQAVNNPDGVTNDAMYFYLEAGDHEIEIDTERAAFAVENLVFLNAKKPVLYQEYQKSNNDKTGRKAEPVYVSAESPQMTSNVSIFATYDRSNSATEPSNPAKLKLNTIGQSNWSQVGQWISWEFDILQDGFYTIAMRARQNLVRGNTSTRRITINNELLFEEMGNVKFPFDSKWYVKVLGDQTPYQFYFKKGHYQIKMEAVPGDIAPIVQSAEDLVYKLNYLYRKIIMITGVSPDQYRDYLLEKEIPDLLASFQQISKELSDNFNLLEKIGVEKGSDSAILDRLAYQLDSFIKKPATIALRLSDFKSNISALSAWMLSLKDQPLELDYLMVLPKGAAVPKANSSFWDTFVYKFRSFLNSFGVDYSSIGEKENKEAINVWVSLGRDQAQILKDLVDNNFSGQHDVKVNISLVQQGLIEATLAGKGPEAAIMVDAATPVNLAARGALVDFTEFDGFNQVKSRFAEYAMEQYRYKDGCYALPATQDFSMLFYRKDIFDELNIKPPATWDEFYRIIPIIQKNNMEIGIPSDTGMFDTLLFQRGGAYYNQNRSATGFDEAVALEAFKQWTGFYTKYSFPQVFDFYNRFRTGEMPMGIQPYTMYNQLSVAAPEIKNLWDMVPIPGIVGQNGTVNHTSTLSGTACIAFQNKRNMQGTWEFLSWFTSADIQYEFGIGLESLLGPAGRYNTANLEALKKIPWSSREYQKLSAQMEQVKAVPQIPASYYVSRHLTNAFRKVVYSAANPRETLSVYNKEINKEIERKIIELG